MRSAKRSCNRHVSYSMEADMKFLRCISPAGRILLGSVLVLSLGYATEGKGVFSSQSRDAGRSSDDKNIRIARDGVLVVRPYIEIPKATEPCTPEECEWWNQVRVTGNEFNKKNDKKLKGKFLALLHEGQHKAYRIPLKDRPAQTLNFGKQTYSDSIHRAIRKGQLSGNVAFSVEFRDDGIVGDVRIVKGLVPDLDVSVLRAIRESVFLPAVENGVFVTSWRTSVAEFSNGHK